ncbi:putative ank-repeat protein mbp1 [Golovinomyces cichoracearum]|uniref:Putative ank-repeat protein mbp1 n=1 Tax=Golovinomyces cichoracearum TaxID=62708 RepID=A0A420J3Z6_9PEZI|nr:putative ank-repeat protein mbp1 [Golovinomyces cichoracearum]
MLSNSASQRKHKRPIITSLKQANIIYSHEPFGYFMLSSCKFGRIKPKSPFNFFPDWIIDNKGHTALHWAAAIGDIEVLRELKRYVGNLGFQNFLGETPYICVAKNEMPEIVNGLIRAMKLVDIFNSTALHNATALTQNINAQEFRENTALYLVAKNRDWKYAHAMIGQNASSITTEGMIQDFNEIRRIKLQVYDFKSSEGIEN